MGEQAHANSTSTLLYSVYTMAMEFDNECYIHTPNVRVEGKKRRERWFSKGGGGNRSHAATYPMLPKTELSNTEPILD